MIVQELALPEVRLIRPQKFSDERGSFIETWSRERYAAVAGIESDFVQDNVSWSARHVLRGLHFQYPRGQGKLVSVLQGRVFDVAVDVRGDSPTFGMWVAHVLDAVTGEQIWIPEGFAHGFVVLSREAVFSYKCTEYYTPSSERTLRWDDPHLAIDWPVGAPILSDKDRGAPALGDMPASHLPRMEARRAGAGSIPDHTRGTGR